MVFPMVLGALASAGAAISSAVATIGTAVSSFAATIAPTLGSILTTLKTYAEPLAKFANTFLQLLGIFKPDEKVEDIGDRAMQAADKGITPDKFEKFDEYMSALRKFELDPEQSARNSSTAKLVAGLGISTVGIEDKFNAQRGSLNSLWLLPLANPSYFTPERMQSIVSAGRLSADIFSYLEKKLSDGESRNFEKSLEIDKAGNRMDESELDKLYQALDITQNNYDEMIKQMQAKNQSASGI